MAIWTSEIKELEKLFESLKGHLLELEKELERLIKADDENMILLYSRRCLEVIITDLCECELKRPRKTEPLKGIIDKLYKEEKVPSHIITSMHGLNELSTYGAHPKDFDPKQIKPVLVNLDIIIKWYLKYKEPTKEDKAIASEVKRQHHTIPLKISNNKWRQVIPWILVGFLSIASVIFWVTQKNDLNQPLPIHKFTFNLPQSETIGIDSRGSAVAISPDGTKLVYVSSRGDTSILYLHNMDEFEVEPIAGTEGASSPFFSPDSKWVAFFANGNLNKVSILGGAPQILCEARFGDEGSWGQDNNIVFSNTNNIGLMRISSLGGTPEQITNSIKFTNGERELSHSGPQVLPGGKTILFTARLNSENMRIVAYSPETGKRRNIIEPGCYARYIQTGHLVYAWKGNLLAVPFNVKKMELMGQPRVILKGVMMSNNGHAHFSISDEGSLVYIPGSIIESENMLVLVDHNGVSESLNIQANQSPQFSSDGKHILYVSLAKAWIYGLERGSVRLFTDKEYETYWAIWTPDGKRIVFNSNREGQILNLFWKMSDGTGLPERLTTNTYHQVPKSWSKDGKTLIYIEAFHPETGFDIMLKQIDGDTTPKPLINTRFNETHPILSPDGRWLAYVSDDSGKDEVFACSFPDLRSKIQISSGGGTEPLWAPNGRALYYRNLTGDKLMVVPVDGKTDLLIGKPRFLFQGNYYGVTGYWGRNYDITPDGKKFLMIQKGEGALSANQINIILNWSGDLKHLVPIDK
jgi:Tol biopolymer transport system component